MSIDDPVLMPGPPYTRYLEGEADLQTSIVNEHAVVAQRRRGDLPSPARDISAYKRWQVKPISETQDPQPARNILWWHPEPATLMQLSLRFSSSIACTCGDPRTCLGRQLYRSRLQLRITPYHPRRLLIRSARRRRRVAGRRPDREPMLLHRSIAAEAADPQCTYIGRHDIR